MSYQIKYSRATNHLAGVAERTQSTGSETGDGVSYYAQSACAQVTRGNLANGRAYESLADAVADLECPQDRKACKRCLAAAKAQLAAEQEAQAKADAPRNAYYELVERVHGNGVARMYDPEFHALCAGEENAELSVSEGVYVKDSWEYFASILNAYEEMLPVYTAEFAVPEPTEDDVQWDDDVADDKTCEMPADATSEEIADVVRAGYTPVADTASVSDCQYSLTHNRMGIKAVTTVDSGPAGAVRACQHCADFHAGQQR